MKTRLDFTRAITLGELFVLFLAVSAIQELHFGAVQAVLIGAPWLGGVVDIKFSQEPA